MRHLPHTHGVSDASLYELIQRKDIDLVYESKTRTCAYINMNTCANGAAWQDAQAFTQVVELAK